MLDDNSSMEKKLSRQLLPQSAVKSESGAKRDFPSPLKNGPVAPQRFTQKSSGGQQAKVVADRRPPPKALSASKVHSDEVSEWDFGVDNRFQGGGKKKNFNQLLNFTSTHHGLREGNGRNWRQTTNVVGHNRRTRQQSNSVANDYNKERFLQANCQFIVVDTGDYSVNQANPDVLVDWDLVEELRLIDESVPTCPICLCPPVAGKITRCGHIFCWPCILHYLALSDDAWRKCPICYESVYKQSLKSVVAIASKCYTTGGRVTMRLMRKEKGTTVVLPKSQWGAQHDQMLRLEDDNSHYAKMLVISEDEVKNRIVARERVELETLLAVERNEPESCFILEALEYLKQREKGHGKPAKSPTATTPAAVIPGLNFKTENLPSAPKVKDSNEPVTFFLDAFDDVSEVRAVKEGDSESVTTSDPGLTELTVDSESMATESNAAGSPTGSNSEKCYYFYQSDDGQPVYLHSVNAKCLTHEFGALEFSPDFISGRVVELERHVMTEELRLRFRYLAHLPLTTNFTVVELSFDKNIIHRDTLEHFADEFHRRHAARQRKAREDKKQTVQAQKWERAMLLDPKNYAIYKNSDPADIPVTTFVKSAQSEIASASASANDLSRQSEPQRSVAPVISDAAYPELGATLSVSGSPPEETSITDVNELSQSPPQSFAQMLRSGRSNKQLWPIIQPTVTADIGPQPRWPVAAATKSVVKPPATGKTPSENVAEEESVAPDFQNAFGSAVEAALAGLSSSGATDGGGKKGKFKKGKGRLLFST